MGEKGEETGDVDLGWLCASHSLTDIKEREPQCPDRWVGPDIRSARICPAVLPRRHGCCVESAAVSRVFPRLACLPTSIDTLAPPASLCPSFIPLASTTITRSSLATRSTCHATSGCPHYRRLHVLRSPPSQNSQETRLGMCQVKKNPLPPVVSTRSLESEASASRLGPAPTNVATGSNCQPTVLMLAQISAPENWTSIICYRLNLTVLNLRRSKGRLYDSSFTCPLSAKSLDSVT